MSLWPSLIQDVYRTYRNDSEHHAIRILIAVIISIAIGAFGSGLSKNAFPVMTLAISVLAGFSFTALFSNHAITTIDLPLPKDEIDRRDIATLDTLGENFRIRSRYFLIMSVVEIIIILSLSFRIDTKSIFLFFDFNSIDAILIFVNKFTFYASATVTIIAFFIFFEFIYTFYRLSETIMSILDIRTQYFSSHIKR